METQSDTRIEHSLVFAHQGKPAEEYSGPRALAFDHHRGYLFIGNFSERKVRAFSVIDWEYVTMPDLNGVCYPMGIAIDRERDRMFVTNNDRLQLRALSTGAILSHIGDQAECTFSAPKGIAIDKHHHRIIIADTNNNRLVFLSSDDLSFLFEVGKAGSQPGEFQCPTGLAIDHDRHRILVCESLNYRVQVLSLIDGSFLFEIGSCGKRPGQFYYARSICIDNQGRIIVADSNNHRLEAFTPAGQYISSFDCGREYPYAVAFDERRGLIAFAADNRVHVIGANQWIPNTLFTWSPDQHRTLRAPSPIKEAVEAMTMIRSLAPESAISMLPNELLFEIFSYL